MIRYIRKKVIEHHCKRDGFYVGKRGRIQKVGYPDRPMWCVAIYKCRNVGQAVKTFDTLDEAVGRLIKIEYKEIGD
jgi:hypothetical protein